MNDPSKEVLLGLEDFGLEKIADLIGYPLIREKKPKIPYEFAKKRSLLPLEVREDHVLVALSDPLNLEAIEEIRAFFNFPIRQILASKEAINHAIEFCYGHPQNRASELLSHFTKADRVEDAEEGYDLLAQTAASPVVQILNAIFIEAIQLSASDIHFEPREQGLSIRYRIDGVLQMKHSPPKEYQSPLLTRIKVLARLDIAEQRLPQDGRIKLRFGEREIDFRVSTIPVLHGERVVLRILDRGNIFLGLNRLGIRDVILQEFNRLIRMSEGIILVTGPTGSGKTTTLYSALAEISSTELNIMTIEDPVEYKLENMAQIGVNPKIELTFARGLRHILRQDPDVIMVGEIRDRETAEIAIQAALTGHLVLSTLHTNDAPSALTRLVDMGIEPYLLSSCVLGVLAQRLVRTLCKQCHKPYEPSRAERIELELSEDRYADQPFFAPTGCSECFGSGFKGRRGIYELMVMDYAIKKQLLVSPDSVELQKEARKKGMVSLRKEGALLVAQGETSTHEVLRAARGLE